ncbi:MAG TPA: adenylate/guanylate cyclase domain-containing protein [Vicinamibacterales bacterium]|nr:adenylate/guanylate cyclase domain-containing protein [Vicinamibacterales bacterium]
MRAAAPRFRLGAADRRAPRAAHRPARPPGDLQGLTLYSLSFVDGAGVTRRVGLRDGLTTIGRAPSCDIVIPAPSVSRVHVRLRVEDGRCLLSDETSTYGTLVNGVKAERDVPLASGDVFQCGEVAITVEQTVEADDLLSESHQLLEDSGTIIRRIESSGTAEAGVADAAVPPGEAWPARERRKGADRRVEHRPPGGPDRRSRRERRQLRLLRLLTEIGQTLVAVQPLPQVLARVIDLVFDVVPAERAFLLLRDSADQALTARVLRHRDGSAPEATLSRTIVGHVMRERVAMLASDALYDPRLDTADSIQAMSVRSFMCAPLWNRNEVIGVLYADNPRSRKFGPDDLDVFTALANYAAVAIEQARTSEQLLQETKRRERLQRYHSPGVVNRILRGGTGVDAPFLAQERDVTVMFCDLVAFTTLCEGLEPYQVAQTLNNFFGRMADEIFEREGTLDKFIGDAILAVFGAPFGQPDHADRAVQAALGMRRALDEINRAQPSRPLQMRIAINSGRALTGDIGSPRRREFTVLGDVVNIASRMESSIAAAGQILISADTRERLKQAIEVKPMGRVALRGRQREVDVFEVQAQPIRG